jgi:hypothetical protein
MLSFGTPSASPSRRVRLRRVAGASMTAAVHHDPGGRHAPHPQGRSVVVLLDEPEVEGRYADVGEFTVSFETFLADADAAPYFRGPPEDAANASTGPLRVTGERPDPRSSTSRSSTVNTPPNRRSESQHRESRTRRGGSGARRQCAVGIGT